MLLPSYPDLLYLLYSDGRGSSYSNAQTGPVFKLRSKLSVRSRYWVSKAETIRERGKKELSKIRAEWDSRRLLQGMLGKAPVTQYGDRRA